ncbi:glycosyltransferase family 4 protein [Nitrospira sp. Nam74]
MKPRKIAFVITNLVMGGAEMMLYKMLSRLNRNRFSPQVVTLMEIGPMGKRIQSLGVPVHALGMARGIPNPVYMLRLARWLREDRPHLVQTWLYHADLLGGLAAKLAGGIPVVWNIRHSNLDRHEKRRLFWTVRTCAGASHYLPQHIICCSQASRREHVAVGYAAEKMSVIPNGSDVESFKPDSRARHLVRQELRIPDAAPLIGFMARFHPQKDHRTFIDAAARLHRDRPDAHFLLCGEEITEANPVLMSWIEGTGAPQCFHLLGLRMDIPRLTASLDIATSTSAFGEGFPNVIIEAMACEVVCVVTDVGDSAAIVGEFGYVVPIRNAEALYQAWTRVIDATPEVRQQLGRAARRRVREHFNLPDIVTRYEGVFERFASQDDA